MKLWQRRQIVRHLHLVWFAVFLMLFCNGLWAGPYPNISLDELITKADQDRMGLSTLTAAQRELVRQALLDVYTAGFDKGRAAAQRPAALEGAAQPRGVVESQVDGEYNGWEGETIVKLMNGQIWQQTEYHYTYHYAYSPKVLVYPSGGGWKMKVDGTDQVVGVTRLQ